MSTLPTWAISPIAAAAMLLSPMFGYLTAIEVEILIGILKGTGIRPPALDSAASGIRPLMQV